MSQRRKVYFYETYVVHSSGAEQRVPVDFWHSLKERLRTLDTDDRFVPIFDVNYAGTLRGTVSPARSFVYLARLRSRDEWPDTFDHQTGNFAELKLGGNAGSLAERSYLLDFGGSLVAVMGISFGAPRLTSIELWLTAVSGVRTSGHTISLRPVLKPSFAADLNRALGARSVTFKIDKGVSVPPDGGGSLGDAARSARDVSGELAVTVTYSAEHARASAATVETLGQSVRWLVNSEAASRGKVKLVLPDGDDGSRVEEYDFFKTRITENANIRTGRDGTRASEDIIVGAIEDAIARFHARQG